MSGSLNKVMIIGNLARDPEVRTFDNGGKVAKFRVLTNETWNDKDGNRQERVEGHDIVVYNDRLVDVVEKYLKKGNKVYLEGMMKTRKYTDKDGNDKYITEVELPRYNAVLTMLGGPQGDSDFGGDNRGGGARSGGGNDRGSDRGGNDRGGRGNDDRGQRGGGGSGGGNRGGGFQDDLDDDVPF